MGPERGSWGGGEGDRQTECKGVLSKNLKDVPSQGESVDL